MSDICLTFVRYNLEIYKVFSHKIIAFKESVESAGESYRRGKL